MSALPDANAHVSTNRRLDAILAILFNPTKVQESDLKQKIAILVRLGFENDEIANILNTTKNLVSKEKSLLKRAEQNE